METDFLGFMVRTNENLICISDFYNQINSKVPNFATFLTSDTLLKHVENEFNIKFAKNKLTSQLKKYKIYKTTGARHTKSIWVDVKLAEILINYENKVLVTPNYIKSEDYFHDILVKIFNGIEIIPQKYVNGFFIDFYIPKFNLAIEYDEIYHRIENRKEKDFFRAEIIKRELDCEIIRVNIDNEFEGINAILKYIAPKIF